MASKKTEKLSGGEALIRSLITEGIDTVFGLPGIQLDPMFKIINILFFRMLMFSLVVSCPS